MNKKIAVNIILSLLLYGASGTLLLRDRLHLSSLGEPGWALLFSGWPLSLLALSLMSLGTLALSMAKAWSRGDLAAPSLRGFIPGGRTLHRFWHLFLLALVSVACFAAAFRLAEKVAVPVAVEMGEKHAPDP